jgi:serine protease DegS
MTAIDGTPISSSQTSMNHIATLKPGRTTVIDVRRNGREVQFRVQIGERPQEEEK